MMNYAILAVTNCSDPNKCDVNLPMVAASDATVKVLLQLVFGVIGALAVFMVLYGAFKFVVSSGDPQAVAKARGTILYSLIGLVIAVLAEVIVSFVLGAL